MAKSISPERLSCIKDYACSATPDIELVNYDPKSGLLDLNDLKDKLSEDVCVLYMENPNFFGVIEKDGQEIADQMCIRDRGSSVMGSGTTQG